MAGVPAANATLNPGGVCSCRLEPGGDEASSGAPRAGSQTKVMTSAAATGGNTWPAGRTLRLSRGAGSGRTCRPDAPDEWPHAPDGLIAPNTFRPNATGPAPACDPGTNDRAWLLSRGSIESCGCQ